MSLCPLPVGEWLVFDRDTCFGSKKSHLGIIIAANDDEQIIVPINATSKVAYVEQFALDHGLNPKDTIVRLSPNDQEAALHFGKETAFDCNRVRRVRYEQLEIWRQCGKVRPVDYNNIVNPALLSEIKSKTLASKLIDEHTKTIIRAQL